MNQHDYLFNGLYFARKYKKHILHMEYLENMCYVQEPSPPIPHSTQFHLHKMIESFKMEDVIMVALVLKDSRNWRGIDIVSFLRGSMVQNLLVLILTVAIEHCGCVQAH